MGIRLNFFNLSKAAEIGDSAASAVWGGVMPAVPAFNWTDMKLAFSDMSTGAMMITIVAMAVSTIFFARYMMRTFFAKWQPQQTSCMVLESLNSNVVNTPFRHKRPWELDAERLMTKNTFPIKPAALITRCKEVIEKAFSNTDENNGVIGICAQDLAEDSVVHFGPSMMLSKDEYLRAVQDMQVQNAFPDFSPNFHNFAVDPVLTNRVWFMSYARGVHNGKESAVFGKPSHVAICLPPTTFSMTFNSDGAVVAMTGAVADATQGNTQGIGGFMGLMYGVGKPLPFPEAQPYSKSVGRIAYERVAALHTRVNRLMGKEPEPYFPALVN
jgi:hypothetical protein